ncbi:MAG TPA: plastocyanin/azurin family copper-binding protein [Opitutaceae bacterium]|nr:plastocyanin/azurin family copper-binding protein [Opitutaceae bacterium]
MHLIRNSLLLSTAFALSVVVFASEPITTIAITASDTLRFNVTHIEARPGQKMHIVLHNASSLPKSVMGHNWVLLRAGQDPTAYAAGALTAVAENYEPKALAGRVIAAVPLLGGGETGEVTFAAPAEAGTYAFLCSSPGHCASGMRGVLVVR